MRDAIDDVRHRGVLRKSRRNPRYFEDGSGRVILLTGSHTWANLQEVRLEGRPAFDYVEYLDMMERHEHNFMRMWQWLQPLMAPWTTEKVFFDPTPYTRSGPGTASDGLPKLDLDRWNESYFQRLRERIELAGERGIYVGLMFFEGWCLKHSFAACDTWTFHPYNGRNNVNGVQGSVDADGKSDVYRLGNPDVLDRQKAFIRKCIDTLNDLDNVMYEIINEIEFNEPSRQWHVHMADYARHYESLKPKQHPVGMSSPGGCDHFNPLLFESSATWVSPGQGPDREYLDNPPENDGSKVVIVDTDHLWGHGGNPTWIWKSFLRGLNPIFMDSWCPLPGELNTANATTGKQNVRDYPDWEPMRTTMGTIHAFARRIDLADMIPSKQLVSTGYCLAKPGSEYLVFMPCEHRHATLDLRAGSGPFTVEWFDPSEGKTLAKPPVSGGGLLTIENPYAGSAVLYLKASPVPHA